MKLLQILTSILIAITHPCLVIASGEKSTLDLSPRTFCKTTNGIPGDSGIKYTFICCYPKKRKCMLSNSINAASRLILIDEIAGDPVLPLLHKSEDNYPEADNEQEPGFSTEKQMGLGIDIPPGSG
jgi:hypothetical protein